MDNRIIIKHSKTTLVLYPNELFRLPPDILQKAITRGKSYKRAVNSERRQVQGFDRWELYETLKGNRVVDQVIIKIVENMNETELREGVCEFLISLNK